jgi:FtsZ-interacting cell division protein YlmF
MPNFWRSLKDLWGYQDEDIDDEKSALDPEGENADRTSKVVSIHKNDTKILCFKPESYDKDILNAANAILGGNIVVLDLELEGSKPDVSRRIIDFLRGIVYAKGGRFMLVSKSTYILTPGGVEISGSEIISKLESNDIYI